MPSPIEAMTPTAGPVISLSEAQSKADFAPDLMPDHISSAFVDTVEEIESQAELACSLIPSHARGAANCTVSHRVDAFSLIVSHVREAIPFIDSKALPKCSLKPSKSPVVNAKMPLRTRSEERRVGNECRYTERRSDA